jgi:hypothetical protein
MWTWEQSHCNGPTPSLEFQTYDTYTHTYIQTYIPTYIGQPRCLEILSQPGLI